MFGNDSARENLDWAVKKGWEVDGEAGLKITRFLVDYQTGRMGWCCWKSEPPVIPSFVWQDFPGKLNKANTPAALPGHSDWKQAFTVMAWVDEADGSPVTGMRLLEVTNATFLWCLEQVGKEVAKVKPDDPDSWAELLVVGMQKCGQGQWANPHDGPELKFGGWVAKPETQAGDEDTAF